MHTNERSINVMLRPFEWMDERAPFLVLGAEFCSKNCSGYSRAGVKTQCMEEMEASTQEIERDI